MLKKIIQQQILLQLGDNPFPSTAQVTEATNTVLSRLTTIAENLKVELEKYGEVRCLQQLASRELSEDYRVALQVF